MIEINLLPGSGKKAKRSGGPSALSGLLANLSGQIKDPYAIFATALAVVSVAAVGLLWFSQRSSNNSLQERLANAVQDSATYSTVILEKRRAESQRDSALRQVNLIRLIDDNRYVWPHVLAEASKALPAYTWLTEVDQLSEAVSPAALAPPDSTYTDSLQTVIAAATTAGDSATAAAAQAALDNPPVRSVAETAAARAPMRFQIIGVTADVQAMTRYFRDLEASPFISDVELVRSEQMIEGNAVLTEFTFQASFQRPDSMFVRKVPFPSEGR